VRRGGGVAGTRNWLARLRLAACAAWTRDLYRRQETVGEMTVSQVWAPQIASRTLTLGLGDTAGWGGEGS
jgi:hypothetical protein